MSGSRSRGLHTPTSSRGFSLIELMVALAAGLIVLTALIAFLMSSFRSNGEYVQSTRLTQELRNTLDLIVRDLRRAGYDDNALNFLGNSYASPFAPIAVETSAEGGCVLYAYDRTAPNGTANGSFAGVLELANAEVRGLRRKEVTVNGALVGVIEYAESSSGRPTCAGETAIYTSFPPTCHSTSGWCALSDPNKVNISAFTVTNIGTTQVGSEDKLGYTDTLGIRELDVSLAGKLVGNTEYTRDVRTSIKIRADCIRPTTAEPLSTPPVLDAAKFSLVCPFSP